MAEIQHATQVSGPTLTRVVDKLVMRSLLYREVDAVDRRKVRVYLSRRGRDLYERVASELRTAEDEWRASGVDPVVAHTLESVLRAARGNPLR